MTNDRKPLPEDDFVGNAAPFVLKITLEYPPRKLNRCLDLCQKKARTFMTLKSSQISDSMEISNEPSVR